MCIALVIHIMKLKDKLNFEEALSSIAARAGMTPMQLLREAFDNRNHEEKIKPLDDDYVELQCELAEQNCGYSYIDQVVSGIKK